MKSSHVHDPLAARALAALGQSCEIPPDVEERILAALPLDLLAEVDPRESGVESGAHAGVESDAESGGGSALEPEGETAGPSSGVFLAAGEPPASLALAALVEECDIPRDIEERILDHLFDAPPALAQESAPPSVPVPRAPAPALAQESAPPSVPVPRAPAPALAQESAPPVVPFPPSFADADAPLAGVLRRAREDAARARRIRVAAGFGALLVAASVALVRPPSGAPVPVNVSATQVPEDDPLLGEVREVVTLILADVARDCHLTVGSTVVWFEKSGFVSVLDVSGGRAKDAACVERVAARHWLEPHDRSTLVQLSVVRAPPPGRPGEDRAGRTAARSDVRVTAWWVDDET